MSERAAATWQEGLRFSARTGSGHEITMDGPREDGAGGRPKEIVLVALAGCTGMDVAAIMAKGPRPPSRLEVLAEADDQESHPKVFTHIRLTYLGEGEEASLAAFQRAVELSFAKYCPVAAMLKRAAEVSYEAYWNGQLAGKAGA